MAISIDLPASPPAIQVSAGVTPLGIDLSAAYIKITSFVWHYQPESSTEKGEAIFTAALWASRSGRESGAAPLVEQQYTLKNPDLAEDILAQCYKTVMDSGVYCHYPLSEAIAV